MRVVLLFLAAWLPSAVFAIEEIRPQARPAFEPVALPEGVEEIRPKLRD